MFINDKYPRATLENGKMQDESDWELITTFVDEKVSIEWTLFKAQYFLLNLNISMVGDI